MADERLLDALAKYQLLLLADKHLPSAASLIAGESIVGSWWGHPAGHEIFRASNELAEHDQVLVCKLLSGKVTFVHRSLWPDVLSIATSRAGWQMHGLGQEAEALLKDVDARAQLQVAGKAVVELERRLLVHTAEVHTARGSHEKLLQSWAPWLDQLEQPLPEQATAQQQLERLVGDLNARFGGTARLPWRPAH